MADQKTRTIIGKIASVLLAVLFWQLAAAAVGNHILIASPVSVFRRFFTIWGDTGFCSALLFSTLRIISGFSIGLLLGCILGFTAARIPLIETLLWPYAALIRAVPVASFIIIALIWLSSRELNIFIPFLMVFPIAYGNTLEGMKALDSKMSELISVYHIPVTRALRSIYLPQLRPYLTAACRIGSGIAWKSGIAAELIGIAAGSIGERLYNAKIYFETEDLFVWTILIVILSVLFEKGLLLLIRLFYSILEAPHENH